ncbi:hypothetical protein [Pantoea sp. At-9b]|jgi:hypothetical protein|uniref:hypothetical protein n=1 Tax=Pantoea sp. (strain At-9b) TaxID=592316 RepID=UPI0001B40431|nr:hypothetical protein [Pantoea sp. At-9b]ADU72125.1 hypothetical protein Pat9b_4797 [Pantoea sp. At-9b]
MLTDERLRYIAGQSGGLFAEAAEMARELLHYRRALDSPVVIIEPLGLLYIGDGKGAMIWPARYRQRNDIPLYH